MAIPNGYYIKARCIKNSWVSEAPPIVREVWDYLLREAAHKDRKTPYGIVKRGQLFRSYKQIRDDLKWRVGFRYERYHESAMKRTMKALRTEGMIELTSEPRGNLITVLNYAEYQDPKNYERTDERTDERTSSEPVANQERSAINKKGKKGKNEKKEEGGSTPADKMRAFIRSHSNKDQDYLEVRDTIAAEFKIEVSECSAELDKFIEYWTEPSKSGKKQKWEQKSTWDTMLRIKNWFRNNEEWGKRDKKKKKGGIAIIS